MLALPDVMDSLRDKMSDLDESSLAFHAATLMVFRQFEVDGRFPATEEEMLPDIKLILAQYGFKIT